MMHDMMSWGGGAMMWGMALFWLLVAAVLVLAIAALIKYLPPLHALWSYRIGGLGSHAQRGRRHRAR
jgi:hypothetical protein